MHIDLRQLADAVRQAAWKEILPRFQQVRELDVRAKADATDLVTVADEAAEHFLKREIGRMMPGVLFVGEESASQDPGLLDRLDTAETAVVVDPLDGTANFVAGMPLFGVMAAVVRHGKPVAGVIYDPMSDDWVMAEQGGGAFLIRPDGAERRLAVSSPAPLPEMVGYVSTDFLPPAVKPDILARLAKARMFSSHRCAAHMYRGFAGGHGHFVMLDRLTPWDHLAGTLIATEAGAYVACLDGSQYHTTKKTGALLTATDPDSWQVLTREIFAHDGWGFATPPASAVNDRPWHGLYEHRNSG
ncbi:fructose-1,6-bisphosphatase/inositol monophosphatase family enzyme [Agrobacterium tumefaciens]|uniref:inositol monophosphatase family protein n=1 Tax=Agrobacterium tumefaciens TaxID=358 RepID=UPI000DD05AA9|nr:inositol monophosphatase [Agrobacterium tumefaciens]MBP2509153.1 fructose-1,6-bisphosphatase/inositol monophosphatase family enzyme [Agrobacterium tumefaciens]MBP2518306.1 fructose-1,6-bisphosphatase/inositol monophosphatase family enzyme [Agrobacterium tumefaciens]MBP2576939.1 fructose-1,6-bisphosphatase/inositol monophosphatase family enzyme [Agrobacterium tumefaciens]MBP2594880.1 fructose-1,6-bisphosphatase/inositol monophosphatase family enzyme [Agrobacterium tumefaciens]